MKTERKEVVVNWIHWSDSKKDYVVIIWSDGTWDKIDLPFGGSHAENNPDSVQKYLNLRQFQAKKIKTTKEEVIDYILEKIFEWRDNWTFVDHSRSSNSIFGFNWTDYTVEEKERLTKKAFTEWMHKMDYAGYSERIMSKKIDEKLNELKNES